MAIEGILEAEIEPIALLGGTIVAVALSVVAYLTAKLRLGWWRPRRPRR